MLKRVARALALVFSLCALAACAAREPVRAPELPKKRIGAVIIDMIDPCRVEFVEAGNEAAADAGMFVCWKASGFDVGNQASYISEFVDRRAHCLLIEPFQSEGLTPFIEKAGMSGIPVVTLDGHIETDYNVCALHNDFADASAAAKILAHLAGKSGRIALISGKGGNYAADQRKAGFLAGMQEFCEISVVEFPAEDTPSASAAAQGALAKYPDVKALHIAQGAAAPVSMEARGKGVILSAQGGDKDGIALVKNGVFAFYVMSGARRAGYWSVRLAAQLAEGQKLPKQLYQSTFFVMSESIKEKLRAWGLAQGLQILGPMQAAQVYENCRDPY